MTIAHEHHPTSSAGEPFAYRRPEPRSERLDPPSQFADLVALNREATRTLHMVARELDDAFHARCLHQPLRDARDAVLSIAVRMQLALHELD